MKFSNICALVGFGLLSLCFTQSARAQWVHSPVSTTTKNIGNGGGYGIVNLGGVVTEQLSSSGSYSNRVTGETTVTFDISVSWSGPPQATYPTYTQQYTCHLSGQGGGGDYAKSQATIANLSPALDTTSANPYSGDNATKLQPFSTAATFAWTLMAHVDVYNKANAATNGAIVLN